MPMLEVLEAEALGELRQRNLGRQLEKKATKLEATLTLEIRQFASLWIQTLDPNFGTFCF